jgi:4a-hydroxytetrahydrobiopterin dehydratase
MATLLDPPLIDDALASLPGWNHGDGEIWREIRLPDELDAELRRKVEESAEAMPHPVQMQRIDGGTRFSLRTEDVGGISELDVYLASRISDLAHQLSEREPGVNAVRQDDPDIVVEGSGPLTTEAERIDPYRKR